jgi:uncharacterized membrane protein (UPF0136 family)
MFIGHFAPAVAAAVHKDAPSLPILMFAAQLVDWAFFGLLIIDVEKMRVTPGISVMNPMDLYHMPYTHSLVGSAGFAVLFGLLVWLMTRERAGALIAALVVLSHWFFDLLVHIPDLTIAGRQPKLGLGLWNHPAIEMPLELAITFGALWLYGRARKPRPALLVALAGLMLALQVVNWFGPVEPDVTPGTSLLAFFAFGLITLTAWRVARTEARH